jgi:hypothetical protein
MFVTLEFDSDLVVVDPQVTIVVTNDRLRHHLLHFLCDDADIGTIAAVITKPIVAKAVGKMAKQDDVVLDGDVGSPSAAATTTAEAAATTAAEASATAAVEAATPTTEGATVDVRVTSSGPRASYSSMGRSLRYPAARRPLSCARPATAGPLSCAGSATGRKLPCVRPPAAGPQTCSGSATSRKLPYARSLPSTGP